jgi:hypothetical protein
VAEITTETAATGGLLATVTARAGLPLGPFRALLTLTLKMPDEVVIEVPIGGEPIKYEMDKASGALVVDRFLYTSMRYPGNYGFIPHTLSGDGDPCDVIVANTRALMPGSVISARIVGVLLEVDAHVAGRGAQLERVHAQLERLDASVSTLERERSRSAPRRASLRRSARHQARRRP